MAQEAAGREERFLKYMHTCSEMYNTSLSEGVISAYWETMKEYSDQEIMRAFNMAFKTCRFFPKPVDLIECIDGEKSDKSLLAWEKVYKAISGVGAYESVQFDDPAIHSCIELMGGWPQLCQCKVDEIKWKQKEFENLYRVMSKREDHSGYLPGIFETDNAARGFKVPTNVKMIGERGEVLGIAGKELKAIEEAAV